MVLGNIVEYIDRQRILCAVILEVRNQRLRLLTENNREINLAVGRLVHRDGTRIDPAMGRTRMVDTLKAVAFRRRALIEKVVIRELWEVLNSEQQWIDLETMTAFCFPEAPNGDHRSAVVRALWRETNVRPVGLCMGTEESLVALARLPHAKELVPPGRFLVRIAWPGILLRFGARPEDDRDRPGLLGHRGRHTLVRGWLLARVVSMVSRPQRDDWRLGDGVRGGNGGQQQQAADQVLAQEPQRRHRPLVERLGLQVHQLPPDDDDEAEVEHRGNAAQVQNAAQRSAGRSRLAWRRCSRTGDGGHAGILRKRPPGRNAGRRNRRQRP